MYSMKMTDADIELLRFAYSKGKSDKEIATLLHTTPTAVLEKRTELGLTTISKPKSMKEAAREYLLTMSDQEKLDFLATIPKKDLWQMAEGSAPTSGTLEVKQEPIRIDITHQLRTVYGQRIIDQVPTDSSPSQLPAGPSE